MKIHNIAINNLRRRKGKVVLLVTGLVVGVAAVVALVATTGALEQDIAHKMDEFGANIIVSPKSESLAMNYAGLNLGGVSFDVKEISQQDLNKIRNIPNAANVRTISPKVFGVLEKGQTKSLVAGVDFDAEKTLKKWWRVDGTLPEYEDEVLVGAEAARRFALEKGSSIDIRGESFHVSGLLEPTGSQDDDLLFISLPVAQRLFDKQGMVGMVEIAALCHNCPIAEIVAQISAAIPSAKVTAVQQVVQGRIDALQSFRRFSLAVAGLVLLVGSMVVFVTMMASVNERTREIGIFSAIGFRKAHIMRIILLEAALVSVAAGIIGYLTGIGGARLFLSFLTDHTPHWSIDPYLAVGAIALAVVLGTLASFYPALAASRMEPSEALRTF